MTRIEKLPYNSERSRLSLSIYGRFVEEMAEHALTIEDRGERQRYANNLIRIMRQLLSHGKTIPDITQKLWDDLAYLTHYELDIDYPVQILKHDELQHPKKLDYPQQRIRYKHYGALLDKAIDAVKQLPEGKNKEEATKRIAMQMKRDLVTWKGANPNTKKVEHDLLECSDGALKV